MKTKSLQILNLLVLTACVFKPTKVEFYDSECKIVSKQYVLTTDQLALVVKGDRCKNQQCAHLLASRALFSVVAGPLSAIVSGSVVIVGNAVFWLEKQGQCEKDK